MSEVWNKWQGHAVHGTFPLHRYLGGSDHSGVFLTELRGKEPAEAAIKLVPAPAVFAQSQLACWEAAAGLSHPHLIRVFETGRCELDGQPFLFAVMEYAEENLAQLLERRAMTEDEARAMLPPVLNALAFLHGRNLVQGQLKPANVLVVGEQIKLASDTVRPVSDAAVVNMVSAYDPPELQDGVCSTAGDIWALGVTLFEALTRKPPLGLEVRSDGVVAPPADFSPTFHEIVTACLSRRPYDRPKVAELEARLRGQGAATKKVAPETLPQRQPAPVAPAPREQAAPGAVAASKPADTAARPPEPRVIEHVFRETPPSPEREEPRPPPLRVPPEVPKPVAPKIAAPVVAVPRASVPHAAEPSEVRRSFRVPLAFAAVALVFFAWVGLRAYSAYQAPMPTVVPVPDESEVPVSSTVTPIDRKPPPAVPPPSDFSASKVMLPGSAKLPESEPTPSRLDIHQEFPDVPQRVRRTIRGHLRVSVRVIVAKDGTVFAALVDQSGPSRYFERAAIEAAKKWTFPPAETGASRLELVRFDFTREGTTAQADSVQ